MSRETFRELLLIALGIGLAVANAFIGRWNLRRFNHRWSHPAIIISAIGWEIFALAVISFGVVYLLHLPHSQENQATTWISWIGYSAGFGLLLIAAILDGAGRISTARANRRAAEQH